MKLAGNHPDASARVFVEDKLSTLEKASAAGSVPLSAIRYGTPPIELQ
jgi:hypothetical protein